MTFEPDRIAELLDRLRLLPEGDRQVELAALREFECKLADELEQLLAMDRNAEEWFAALEAELDERRYAELDAAWAPGQRIGPYRLERLIAAGGMGAVFLARKADGELKRPVALKLIPPGVLADDENELLRRERDALARLSHPNIAQLFDAGVDADGQPWFALEFIDGLPLREWCGRNELSRAERLALFLQLCSAVLFAHRHLTVHGDIKPANVMVDRYGRVKLLDFGIARLMQVSGAEQDLEEGRYFSPAYAAPELKKGSAASVSSDIYALGIVLRELEDLSDQRDLPAELNAIISKACREDPDSRYESVSQLIRDLSDFLAGRPVQAYPGHPGYRLGKWLTRHSLGASVGALMLAVILGFALFSSYQAEIYQRERDKATQLSRFLSEVFVSADPEFAQGHELTARELLDRGVRQIDRVSADPGAKNEFLMLMARTYRGLGDFEQARALFLEALSIQKTELDSPAGERAATLTELGQTEHANGKFEQSEEYFRQAMELLDRMEGDKARLLSARIMGKYGRMLGDQGNLDEGLQLIQQALEITRAHPDSDPVDLAERLNDLGSAYFRRGQHKLALQQLEEALRLRRRIDEGTGRASPRTATIMNNIGLMHYLSGAPSRAHPYFQEALVMRRSILPESHPDIAQTLTNHGLLLKDEGQLDAAIEMLQEALEIRRSSLRPDHLRIGQAMHNLAMAYQQNGDFEKANRLYRDAIVKLEEQLGNRHPMIAVANNDFASLLFELGDLEGAERHYRIAQRIRNETLPPKHPHIAWSLSGLGRVLMARGRYSEAIPLLQEALAIRRQRLPSGDPLIAEVSAALEAAKKRQHGGADVHRNESNP